MPLSGQNDIKIVNNAEVSQDGSDNVVSNSGKVKFKQPQGLIKISEPTWYDSEYYRLMSERHFSIVGLNADKDVSGMIL